MSLEPGKGETVGKVPVARSVSDIEGGDVVTSLLLLDKGPKKRIYAFQTFWVVVGGNVCSG